MKIYLATISHQHGINMYAATSRAERLSKIAGYCRDWWHEYQDLGDVDELTDQQIIDTYFDADAAVGGSEYCDLGEDEVVNPLQKPGELAAFNDLGAALS